MKDKNTVKIHLDKNELKKLIKKYYINNFSAVIDKIKCVEVFRDSESVFYSTAYKTIVTGKIETIRGNYNRFVDERDIEGTKEIIRNALATEYNYSTSDVSIGARYDDNRNGGFDVTILGAECTVDQKILKRGFKKSEK